MADELQRVAPAILIQSGVQPTLDNISLDPGITLQDIEQMRAYLEWDALAKRK
jgi:hypothetical protein